MSDAPVDHGKRKFLIASTSALGAVGAVALAAPLVASLTPSERAKAAGAPVEIDLSKVEPGMLVKDLWRKQAVWVLRRTEKMLADLDKNDASLKDPQSAFSKQPEYAKNAYRSDKEEWLVLVGICTHLGCSPTHRPEVAPADLGADWLGGWYCPCHGSKFDHAGRVFNGSPAGTNLVVPIYSFKDDNTLIIGVDKGAA